MSPGIPKVSVVMPVYNGEKYLEQAIGSVLNQTFEDFELVIIDDGSKDNTCAILSYYEQQDKRIRVYHQENQGVIAARNKGCQLARGKYIAVMDADDINLPDRLAKEYQYLESHSEIGILGSWVQEINQSGYPRRIWRHPTAPAVIKWYLIFDNCLPHSSVMMRRDIGERLGFYRAEIILAEDYDLFARASDITRIANLPQVLIRYRYWERGISNTRRQMLEQCAGEVMHSMMTRVLGTSISPEESASLRQIIKGSCSGNLKQIDTSVRLIKQLYQAYLKNNSLSKKEMREITQDAGERLYSIAASARRVSFRKTMLILTQAISYNPFLLMKLTGQIARKAARKLPGQAKMTLL